jgi:beta-lactamase superfamily II metal-dependent hydrolase
MLTFHILDVGHGSSVLIELETAAGRSFGVIDSNASAGQEPKALTKLREKGATKLAFVGLTHPHKDHFSGLYTIICAFPGAIDQFYSCPMGELFQNKDRLKKLTRKCLSVLEHSDGRDQRRAALEFAQILIWADEGARNGELGWHECKGEEFSVAPPGFSDVEVCALLPPSRVVGTYVQRILKEDMSVLGGFEENDISIAFRFSYRGRTIILGGDGTAANWAARRRYEHNKNSRLSGDVVNLPHHGSKHDCEPDVLMQLFSSAGRRIGITSANGITHPDLEVIEWLQKNSIEPYCTNLIPACGANAQRLLILPGLEPQLARWVREVADDGQVQACQGDVVLRIEDNGDWDVIPEHRNMCGYRGDYDRLLSV